MFRILTVLKHKFFSVINILLTDLKSVFSSKYEFSLISMFFSNLAKENYSQIRLGISESSQKSENFVAKISNVSLYKRKETNFIILFFLGGFSLFITNT